VRTERQTFAPLTFTPPMWNDSHLAERGDPTDIRVLTWNVWFGGYMFEARQAALCAELGRRRPDVIALQEVTQGLLEALRAAPWVRDEYQVSESAVWSYDVVLLSRLPIRRMARLDLPTEMGRRLIVAELASGLAVATVHLESTREEAKARARQLGIIQPALAGRYDDVVLVGDMNFEPGDPLENAALDPTFVDVWPTLRPGEPGYTVDTDLNTMRLHDRRRPAHKRIDRMFARSRRWRARSIELVGTRPIDSAGTFASDHFGLETSFAIV